MSDYVRRNDVLELLFYHSRMKSDEVRAVLESVAADIKEMPAGDAINFEDYARMWNRINHIAETIRNL